MSLSVRLAVALSAAALLVSACSSGGSGASPSGGSATASPTPVVSVDPTVREELDPGEGQVIVPGSIDSVEQNLTGECATAVAPLRAFMDTYPNVFSMSPADTEKFNKALPVAKEACGGDTGQQWVDFYTLELAGWMYAENPDGAKSS